MIVTAYNLCVPDRLQSGRGFSLPGLFQRDWLACEFVVLYALFERIILHFWRRLHRLLTGHDWVRLSCTENEWGLRKEASHSLVVNANVLVYAEMCHLPLHAHSALLGRAPWLVKRCAPTAQPAFTLTHQPNFSALNAPSAPHNSRLNSPRASCNKSCNSYCLLNSCSRISLQTAWIWLLCPLPRRIQRSTRIHLMLAITLLLARLQSGSISY